MSEQLKKLGGFMTKDAYASYSNSFKSYAQDISSISVMTKEEEQQIIPKIINNDDMLLGTPNTIDNNGSKIANYRYVYHWVCKEYEKLKALGQGARADLNVGIIKNYSIPIPYSDDLKKSLKEQERIVAILDQFDTLTHSISEGLPREIELRQKQYAYYRDLLFSFPKPETLNHG